MIDITFTMPQEPERFEVHVFADLHSGDENYNEATVKARIEKVKNNPNAYCILNGDLMNTALKLSRSDIYKETMTPMEQMNYIKALFAPIKDKIIMIDEGNHEERISRDTSISTTEIIANDLGVAFAKEGALIFIQCGRDMKERHPENRITYALYVTHGSGGGRTEGGKMNAVAQLASIVDADIYVHSHTHLPGAFKRCFYRTIFNRKKSVEVTKLFVSTASALDYGGYAQRAKFAPLSKDNPVIILDGREKRAEAIV